MKKTTIFALIVTLAVVLGFAGLFFLAPVQSLDAAQPSVRGATVLQTRPIWEITKNGKANSVMWVDADNPRFAIYDPGTPEVYTDDAVLDKETGLVWQRSPLNRIDDWYDAIDGCYRDVILANRMGSRLPTIEEAASLLVYSQGSLALPTGHPFINVQDSYWSSTSYQRQDDFAWYVNFDGSVPSALDKSYDDGIRIWCVRGGQGHDAPADRL